MTIKEVILAEVPVDIDDNAIERILLDRSLAGGGTYSASRAKEVNLAIADTLVVAVRNGDFTEGGLSIKIPRSRLINDAKRLYRDNGEPEKASSLNPFKGTDISNQW